MSRICELTGKTVLSGNAVSHSNRKTRRKFKPNLQKVTFISSLLNQKFSLRVATRTIKTVDINGGLDSFLLSIKEDGLSERAAKIRRQLKKLVGSAS